MTQVTFQTTALATPPNGTNVDVNAGTNSDATQRVTIATDDALNTVLGATSDAASVSTSIKAALRAISTALGITALDLGSGTGGSRTLRFFADTAQWIGGSGTNGTAVQRVTVATDDTLVSSLATKLDTLHSDSLPTGAGTAAAAGRVTLASDDPAVATLGATTGAKVITDANGTIQQYLRGLVSQWVASTLTFASTGYSARIQITRPSDATTYTANDVVGVTGGGTACINFTNMGVAAKEIIITSARFQRNVTALGSGESNYLLHLYNATQPGAQADNAAFDIAAGDQASYLGTINLGTPTDYGSTLATELNGINKQVLLGATSSIFGVLVTVGSYQPATATVHVVELHSIAP